MIEFSLRGESMLDGMESQATGINEAFLIFWQQFLLGMEKKEPNSTSAHNSILTSSWLEVSIRK